MHYLDGRKAHIKISHRQKLTSMKTKNSELRFNAITEKRTRPTKTAAWFQTTLSRNHSGTVTVAKVFARTTPPASPSITLLAMLNRETDALGISGTAQYNVAPLPRERV